VTGIEELEEDRGFQKRFNRITLIVLLFTVFSGALRKWGLQTGAAGNAILGLQLVVPLLYIFLSRSGKHAIPNWWVVFWLVMILGVINPYQLTLFHGFFGMILYLGFPLMLLKYFDNRHRIDFTPIIWILIGMVGLEFFLGMTQYFLPPGHILNKYAIESKELGKAMVGDKIRVTGTFSYLGGFGTFVGLAGMLTWAQLVERKRLVFIIPMAVAGVGCALFSGSRGAVINFLLFAGVGLFHYVKSPANFIKILLYALLGIFVLSYFNLGGLSDIFSEGYDNILLRFGSQKESLDDSDLKWRSLSPILRIFNFDMTYNTLIGVGIGSTYQGANAIWGISDAIREVGFFEDEIHRVLIEGGYLMLLVRFLMIRYLSSQLSVGKIASGISFFYLFFFGNFIFNIYGSVFTAVGMMMVDHAYYKVQRQKEADDKEEAEEEEGLARKSAFLRPAT
jgi:hypothetical protein